MAPLNIFILSLVVFGNLVCSFPLESLPRPVEVSQSVVSSSYILSKPFNDHNPNLNENKGNKANETNEKHPPSVTEKVFDYKTEQNVNNDKDEKEANSTKPTEKPISAPSSTQDVDSLGVESYVLPKDATEAPDKDFPEKQPFKVIGTMPRFGRAFGPLGPPPSAKKEEAPKKEAKPEEKIEDLPKPSARVSTSELPQQIVNDRAESSKIELRKAPQIQQYAPYPLVPGPPPPPHYNDGIPYPPNHRYGPPPHLQQRLLPPPPPIPYYNQVRLNDSITRVDFLLSYDVESEEPGEADRFGRQEKTQDGFIQGEYGFHVSNGGIRGVRYTADPNVHPQLLYDTLIKFLAL